MIDILTYAIARRKSAAKLDELYTEKTVKEFQSAHGLTADGIAGAKTKAALAKQL